MKKLRLLKSLLTFICITLTVCIPISIYGADKEEGLYIKTEEIPQDIEEQAKSLFLSTNYKDIEYLGINAKLENLTLSKGVKANLINGGEKYYFFVLDGDKIVANIVVSQSDGEVYGTYSTGVFENLNKVRNTYDNPISIIVSKNSIYYLDNTGLQTISDSFWATNETIAKDKSTIERSKSLYLENENSIPVLIGESNVYDIKLDTDIKDSKVVMGLSLDNFPCVPNKDIYGGICWASSTGAIIEYINNGKKSTVLGGIRIRDELVKKQTTGGINDAQKYIKDYTNVRTRIKNDILSWEECKNQINSKGNPCYLRYADYDDEAYHAVVLCGYDYDNGKVINNEKKIYLMDPNLNNWQKIKYGSKYLTNYGYDFECEKSLYKR